MSESRYRRKSPFRQTKEEVLVVCGGQTEQIYFDLFKQVFRPSLGNISVITAVEAKSPMQIVAYAIRAQQRKEDYNAVWCVFDKDDFTDFDDAIAYAGRHKIGAAFSNQAFEVWFINHFRLLESSLHRNKYKEELGKLLVFPYDKNRDTVKKVCDALLTEEKVKTAIVHSRLGYERHVAATVPSRPSAFESCTTVYMLTRSLLNWVE
ncbi:MAG: RloB family protein [Peptococcaceae bacterium]|nr:RloB family protein [Peptococcaceae bacterium]